MRDTVPGVSPGHRGQALRNKSGMRMRRPGLRGLRRMVSALLTDSGDSKRNYECKR